AHMGQHLLLLLIAAPLLVMGTPAAVLGWLIPWPNTRRTLAQWWQRHPHLHHLTRPWVAWLAYGLTLWLWHLPVLYEAALRLRWVHYVEHALFLSTAVCFWWVLLRQTSSRYGLGLFLVFTTALHGGLLAVLLTFAPRPWYPIHATTAALWGLTPLEDQQLAGALMWVPSSLIYVVAAVYLLSSWFKQLEQRDHRRSRYAE
ncbi:MAG: cytochrome c oxidase assembly protein, partial [Anaerolineales bacterium]|nr:cytochrome c oxidase assembly protein [Anaerolineales bacterium]